MAAQLQSRTAAQARTPFVAPAVASPGFTSLPPMPRAPAAPVRRPPPTLAELDRQKLVGQWTTDKIEIERGQSGPATLDLQNDGTFVLHSEPPKGPVDISGNWSVVGPALRLRATQSSVASFRTALWRGESLTDDTVSFRIRGETETWKKQ